MAYIDKINKNSTDYDLQDSKAARSVDGTTASHVELTNQIFTESTQATTASFAYRTTAGDVSIETGDAAIQHIDGNTVQTGHTDEVLNTTGVFADSGTTVSLTASTWRTYVSTDGIYSFSYDGTNWKLNDATVTLADYGLTVTGTVTDGDSIVVEYTQLVIGTLATATPTSFVATGFNQYDATAGYAHVVGNNQYRIAGTYTSLGFTTTIGGATTPVTVADNRFTPTEDGYIYITGASGNILIALVWSGTMDSEPYSAYSTTSVTIPTVDASNNSLPTATYGMPSVHGVADRLSFADKTYIQRIGHYTYSAANLATVEAMGVDYWYDTNDIFYVLASPVTYTLADSVSGVYTANDYGTEEIIGTTVPMTVGIVYGNSLVDKLRNMLPIQSIGTGLTLTGTELSASGGGQSTLYDIYSTKTTSNSSTGGAIYLGNLDATQQQQPDPTTTDNHYRYFWALPYGNTTAPSSNSVNILGYKVGTHAIAIGVSAKAPGNSSVAVGNGADCSTPAQQTVIGGDATISGTVNSGSVIVGYAGAVSQGAGGATVLGARASGAQKGCVALGYSSGGSTVLTEQGIVAINTTDASYGYKSTNYRLLTGVYDGQSDHDAVTLGQLTSRILASGTAAPTTSTVGAVGALYAYVASGTGHLAICTDDTGGTYTWQTLV